MNCSRSAAFQYFDIFKDSAAYPYNDSSTNTTYKCKACFLKYKDEFEESKTKYEEETVATSKKRYKDSLIKIEDKFRIRGLGKSSSNLLGHLRK